ncbi:MAG: glycosyltransferase [Solirubrobacteraceae bacterium]
MRISVVINTYNRAASLRTTLAALRHQTYGDFEVVVVNGPSDDGTDALLAARAAAIRVTATPERNLAKSRNLGIDAAAGEVVAFIDDDAIPEARWLEQLAAAYSDPAVGGAGGLTLNPSGTHPQYRYSVCDRIGRTDFDRTPPFGAENAPGADPFLYLQGTNCSFRRTALERVEGFDEEIEYNYDEAEVCAAVIDAGMTLRALDDAVVHHKFLPSHMRRAEGFTDPFFAIKNRAYFALRVGAGHRSREETLASLKGYVEEIKRQFAAGVQHGRFTQAEHESFAERADAGLALGVERGTAGLRRGRAIRPADPDAFLPYPVLRPEGGRVKACFVSLDYPPRPLGGVGRYTQDIARGMAAEGHEVHVIARDDEGADRLDFEEGVWVHRVPGADRYIPELDGQPLKGLLEHAATVRGAVERAAARVPFDVVTASSWVAEPLLCALDGTRPVNVVCVTPMRTIAAEQPHTAAATLTHHQIRMEDALLRVPGVALQPISHEVAQLVGADRAGVLYLGTPDRRADFPQRSHDGVEILFAGRLEPRKGIDTLLEAGADLLRARPQARLRIAGPDNPHANGAADVWPAWVAEHAADVADRIEFAGRLTDDELLQAYADCDVFCGPSRYESFGLVQVEAMMMGRPVVACDAGGMRETVAEAGVLVAPGDADALREALEALVDDPGRRERLGAAARQRYEAELTLDIAVARHVERFRSLPAPPPGDLPALLGALCGLDATVAARAAAALRDPKLFPADAEGAVRRALTQGDAALVGGLYRALLGRSAEPETVAALVDRMRAGADPRALAREIATSPEAGLRGLDLGFLERLPPVARATVRRSVATAWLYEDDAAFATAVHTSLDLAPPHEGAHEPPVPRAEIVRRLLTIANLPATDLDWLDELRTEGEIADRLSASPTFLEDAYRLLLGRPADPVGRAAFGGSERGSAVRAIGLSAEARDRGFPSEVAERIAARMPVDGRRARLRQLVDGSIARTVMGAEGRLAARFEGPRADLAGVRRRLEALARDSVSHHDVAELREGLAELRWAIEGLAELRWAIKGLAELRWAIEGLAERLDVLAGKHEAMALDVREKLPATAPASAPEPRVPDPVALAGKVVAAGALRVNVGCGEKPLEGYVNVDFRALSGVDVVADAARLPFAPGTVDELASFHLIEHFREHHAQTVLLPYWRSLLKPGTGRLRVVTPNWAVLMEQLRDGRLDFRQFKTVTFGAQDYSGDDHFALYSPQTLERLLTAAGFTTVEVLADRRQNGLSPEMEVVATG